MLHCFLSFAFALEFNVYGLSEFGAAWTAIDCNQALELIKDRCFSIGVEFLHVSCFSPYFNMLPINIYIAGLIQMRL